jgi:hypothetical protein
LHFDYCRTPEESASRVAETLGQAAAFGRHIQVWIPASVVCRPTSREVDEFTRYCVDNADWEALKYQYRLYQSETGSRGQSPEENARNRAQVRRARCSVMAAATPFAERRISWRTRSSGYTMRGSPALPSALSIISASFPISRRR